MFSLYIDNLPAVVASGTSIKITRENPAFSSNGDRSLDVVLPLRGCVENLAIFGSLNNRSHELTPMIGRILPFRLVADQVSLSGTATVKAVTEKEVKVQLKSGSARFVAAMYDRNGKERYIDTLELGNAYDTVWKWVYPTSVTKQTLERTLDLFYRGDRALVEFMMYGLPYGVLNDGKGKYGGAECVNFSIYSVTDGGYSNPRAHSIFSKNIGGPRSTYEFVEELRTYNFPQAADGTKVTTAFYDTSGGQLVSRDICFAPQPYLCVILERVLSVAYGMPVRAQDNCLRWHSEHARLFVANARVTLEYAKCLPHWTVSEFIKEVERFCGVVVYVDSDRIRILPRSAFYQAEEKRIEEVVREFTAELDAEGEVDDVSGGNVGYDWQGISKVLSLPDDAWKGAKVERVASIDSVRMPVELEDKDKSKIFIDDRTGRHYAFVWNNGKSQLIEIDQGGPLVRRETRDTDISLRIVPCLMDALDIEQRLYVDRGTGYVFRSRSTSPTKFSTLVTGDRRLASGIETFNLFDYLEDKTPDTVEDRSIMEVAANRQKELRLSSLVRGEKGHIQEGTYSDYYPAFGFGYYVFDGAIKVGWILPTSLSDGDHSCDWNLHAKHSRFSLVGGITALDGRVDTRCEYCFTFTDPIACDPLYVYHIGTRYFLAHKFELTLTPEGLLPLKTGYFYELIR